MSEEKNFNGDVFQSFSKDYILESNKNQNKTYINESTEFSFKKNLSINDEGSNHNHNYNNKSAINDPGFNIYSVNDKNIQESGHFGKSKYESKNFKSMIERNNLIKNPLFYEGTNMEEENVRNINNVGKNDSNSNFFNNQLKKIQIIRKKKSNKDNNNVNYNCLKKNKIGPNISLRNNKKIEEEIFMLKKKYSNFDSNTMKNISNISSINNYSYNREKEKINKTFYRNNIYELNSSNQNYYINENNHLYKKINQIKKAVNKTNNYNMTKSPTLMNLNENKENLLNNFNRNSKISPHYKNIINILKSNNSKYYSINDVNSTNLEPEKLYRKIKVINKSSNQNYINEIKNKKNKSYNLVGEASHDTYFRKKRAKGEIKNRIINENNDMSYDKINLNKISAQCLGVFKAKEDKIQNENKRGKYSTYRVALAYDKRNTLKEQILPYYFENHGINF